MQSIPAVFALKDGKVVDGFVGALPEAGGGRVRGPADPCPLRSRPAGGRRGAHRLGRKAAAPALELQPDHEGAITALARMLIDSGQSDEAMALLRRIPETADTRVLLAEARLSSQEVDVAATDVDALLDGLLNKVRDDDDARQEFVDLLETLGPADPRTARYRKALSARLF